ncbi:long-chain-fatty-acid--CoA ligase [Ectothiorhodospiraceae bacterium WFHF3C12]|nr:long-chain-fatty-acid--CoA ligase [Ectothiorhodospiraceae bacterium WFHF3C12]
MIERVCVGDITTRSADLYPNDVAIVDGERRMTYRELDDQANRLGHALLDMGLRHGDVVGVVSRNSIEQLVTYFACAKAGLICAPANLGLRAEEIAYCFKDSGARVLIVEDALAELAASLPGQLPAVESVYWTGANQTQVEKSAGTFDDLLARGKEGELEVVIHDRDPVQLLYTSGTTALPKGVLTSHLSATIAAMSDAIASNMQNDACVLLNLPLFHCTALNTIAMPAFLLGGKTVLMKAFEIKEAARLIEQEKVNLFVFLPMMYAELLADPEARARDFSHVRRAIYAMAPMPEERLKAIHELFPNADVVLGSGQTEFTPATCMQRPEHQWSKAPTWGTATVMTRVGIMDDEGNLLPRGESGEIVYRGPQVMNGYLNLPEKTAESFEHGWFHSGDVAWMDEDGAIWFHDRKKDVIKTGGENVASIEVERCVMSHPGVAEAAVVGLPHDRWGEAITAVVVRSPDSDVDEDGLLEHCKANLAGFKVPKAVVFVDEFPRTGTGKIQKHMIRDQQENLFEERDAAE